MFHMRFLDFRPASDKTDTHEFGYNIFLLTLIRIFVIPKCQQSRLIIHNTNLFTFYSSPDNNLPKQLCISIFCIVKYILKRRN